MSEKPTDSPRGASRRRFLRTGSALAGGALLGSAAPAVARTAHNSVDETLRVGLVGCGGRGRGAALNALRADLNVQLVALGDAFDNMLQDALTTLHRIGSGSGDVASMAQGRTP